MITATYSDGSSSKPHRVALFINRQGVVVSGQGILELWTYYEISKIEKGSNLGLFKGDKIPFESIHIDEKHQSEVFERLQHFAPEAAFLKERHLRFEKKGLKAYSLAFLGIIAVLVAIHFVVIPGVVNAISATFPEDLEQQLGERYFNLMTATEIIDESKSQQVQEIADRLDFQTHYHLEFYVVESEIVNAFALPGGKIVIFSGLIKEMNRVEQLVALMGHESGHVALRHSLQNIFRDQSYAIVISSLLGGGNAIVDAIAGITETLNALHGSRQLEQEADFYALDVLYANQLDPNGAIELFKILSDQSSVRIPDVLSTHTASDTRAQEMSDRIPRMGPQIHQNSDELNKLFEQLKSTKIENKNLEIKVDENLGW